MDNCYKDAYGDGWNGGYITALNGVATNYAAAGTGTTHVEIPSGTTSLI